MELDSPIDPGDNSMQVLFALFTKVLVWARGFFHNSHTAAVLPDLARVTLDEKTSYLFREAIGRGC